jgi:hypothetical protein
MGLATGMKLQVNEQRECFTEFITDYIPDKLDRDTDFILTVIFQTFSNLQNTY